VAQDVNIIFYVIGKICVLSVYKERGIRIKILLDNDLAIDGFMVFYLLYDNLIPFFEADTNKSTIPPPLFTEFAIWGYPVQRQCQGLTVAEATA
jgi:hypothetical protein